jgi:hypothetical protein
MKRKTLVTMAIVIAVVAGATSYASPYWALYQMRTAIDARDSDKFSRYVDYPALRDDIKGQFLGAMRGKLGAQQKQDPLSGLGQMIGLAMVNMMIDVVVSPSGMMALMAGEKLAQPALPGRQAPEASPPAAAPSPPADNPGSLQGQPGETQGQAARHALRYSLSYQAWSEVRATATRDDGKAVVLRLQRTGPWTWKLAGVTLPDL